MSAPLADSALDQLFRTARTFNGFTAQPVDDATIHDLYELLKWGPTSVNCQPGRYVFVRSAEARQRLAPALAPGNLEKTLAAPVTVIVAHDSRFQELLPTQFHAFDAKALFDGNTALAQETMFRNGTLQGAYLMLAARALGLGCGPMSGFDATKVNAEFFPDGRYRANFLCNLGYGDPAKVHPRGPRLGFEAVAKIL
ncbi:malonic semialdehyde reductase [Zoogloea sp.]|uniref:malonic semialdehyde reductase n=1 Tax=Zoogloea sp. TaxID=49181 RepID=UPI002C562B17|nr:malonic semialdehyde reductase [Zoogloea sp.]HNH17895.1 malonic semialdehyde reductase [Zoogloea sp.]